MRRRTQMRLVSRVLLFVPVVLALLMVPAAREATAGDASLKLDIDKCVRMALEVNVSVLKAEYELSRARNSVINSASYLLPDVGISTRHSKYETEFTIPVGDTLETTDESYRATLAVSENITVGSVMGLFESFSYKRATEHYVRGIRHQVAYMAKQKYLEVLKAERLLEVRQEALDLGNRRLEKAQALMDVGSAVRSDVLRAQVEVSMNELDLISARHALRLAETDLQYFLGIVGEPELELEDILETAERDYGLDSAVEEALTRRPDVLEAEATLKTNGWGVWRERGGWFPSLNFTWSDQYSEPGGFPDGFSTLRNKAQSEWHLSVSMNLFDGLETFSRVRSAKASRESAREDYDQARRDASYEVKQAFYKVEEARQRVKVSRETVGLAEEELRLAEERYRLGGGTMLEQIDSQVALSEARKSYVEALYDYLLSQAELERAMGRD
jgi:outer membrane protein TolC